MYACCLINQLLKAEFPSLITLSSISIITDTGGLKEVVENAGTGLVCASIDANAITNSIKTILH